LPRPDWRSFLLLISFAAFCAVPAAVHAQALKLLQASALRAERSPEAQTVTTLATGQAVTLLQMQGGWARVQVGTHEGWMRASALQLPGAEIATASQLEGGRRAPGAAAVTLGVRTLPPRSNRHALIIGLGRYQADPQRPVSSLAGVPHDMLSAMAMARLLQVPPEQMTLLRDAQATREGVRQALLDLGTRVQRGDRVFVYWSGHGSRYFDAAEGGCVETLVPYDLKDIGNREFAQWLQPAAAQADKMMVVYDACHSGGVGAASHGAARSLSGKFKPKSAAAAAACQQPSNLRTRSWDSAARAAGVSGQDVVHLSSSRPDEVSFDNANSGGLATSALRQCMQGEARDSDSSGAISVDELASCAQLKIEAALRGQPQLSPHHLVVTGNRSFVPAWFAAAPPTTAPAPMAAPAAQPAPPVLPVLEQIHAQRDSKRRVEVLLSSEQLRIGIDMLDFAVTSSHAGHVYVAMLGSDGHSLTLLFPNTLDARNTIAAGESLLLPRPAWRLMATGPHGANTLLVMVTDQPRDVGALTGAATGPFTQPRTDADGRAQLQRMLAADAFGSALVSVSEY
jgi:hypothetical protein